MKCRFVLKALERAFDSKALEEKLLKLYFSTRDQKARVHLMKISL